MGKDDWENQKAKGTGYTKSTPRNISTNGPLFTLTFLPNSAYSRIGSITTLVLALGDWFKASSAI